MSDRINRVLDKAKQRIKTRSDVGKQQIKKSTRNFVKNTFRSNVRKVVRRKK